MILLSVLATIFPATVGAKANPLVTPEVIKPEWFFYVAFRWLKLFSGTFAVVSTGFIVFIMYTSPPWSHRMIARGATAKSSKSLPRAITRLPETSSPLSTIFSPRRSRAPECLSARTLRLPAGRKSGKSTVSRALFRAACNATDRRSRFERRAAIPSPSTISSPGPTASLPTSTRWGGSRETRMASPATIHQRVLFPVRRARQRRRVNQPSLSIRARRRRRHRPRRPRFDAPNDDRLSHASLQRLQPLHPGPERRAHFQRRLLQQCRRRQLVEWRQGPPGGRGSGANGTFAFQTPLATGHKFNGWADKFLTTPKDGLVDWYFTAGGKIRTVSWLVTYHDYSADFGDDAYGSELNAQVTYPSPWKQVFAAKFAIYREAGFSRDTSKLWVWTQHSF